MVSTNNYPFLTLTYENIIDDTLYSSIKEHISEFNILEKSKMFIVNKTKLYIQMKKKEIHTNYILIIRIFLIKFKRVLLIK